MICVFLSSFSLLDKHKAIYKERVLTIKAVSITDVIESIVYDFKLFEEDQLINDCLVDVTGL